MIKYRIQKKVVFYNILYLSEEIKEMKPVKRDAKRQVDQILFFASLRKLGDLPEQKLRKLFREFLEILYGAEAERERVYDKLSTDAVSFRRDLQRLADELHSLIQEVRKEAGRSEHKAKWHVIPGRPFRFHVLYDIYFKDDRVSVRPLGDTRVLTKGKKGGGVGLLRSLENEEMESSNLLKYRFFSLLEKAELPVSSIRACIECKRFFSATERKKKKQCRTCLQRAIRRKWKPK